MPATLAGCFEMRAMVCVNYADRTPGGANLDEN